MFGWLRRLIGRADNSIDRQVDRVIYRLETDTPEEFQRRLSSISGRAVRTLILAVKEQLQTEVSPDRLEQLKRLDVRLAMEADRRSSRKTRVA
jgi:hypothetical protein